ncbi:PEP-CTERM sorting domain-containing protein [Funiculus sociatus GB2-A5]|uniref:PEP-CTERM sorting domain-containing protein n=1 Tax=Funiculus sociatus GB2-A5 TaxID=2933946 RepID=A0ABV0JME5_9CYAN|nr:MULTISPECIES: choice-of-anchor tandem repeat NxxGxxAF-containing protein [unclassified Trichocoleus]MBD1906543.1 PEP-CTERM sorting domain-containing protein [Trichocoleus sp. FACHB-832]MBD2063047.1 PEP-CTERM sorting domain-containing protein [Trichocoleus sp. FACHB-6]
MKLHLSASTVIMGLCLGFLAAGEAQAASFTFTKIADTSGSFNSFLGKGIGGYEPISATPAINNQGTVAFSAFLDAGGKGIFTGNGTTTTTIANTNNLFGSPPDDPTVGYALSELGSFSINDLGNVAFEASLESGGIGIFTSQGDYGVIESGFTSVYSPSINNPGTVVFLETISRFFGQTRIRTSNSNFIAVTYTCLPYFCPPAAAGDFRRLSAPIVNDAGTVAFQARVYQSDGFLDDPDDNYIDLSSGIFTGNGTTDDGEIITNTIADSNGAFNSFSDPSINNSGTVAFTAVLDTGRSGVFTGNGTTTTTIADSSGAFNSFFGTPSINDFGIVAFLAGLDVGGSGIFTGNNPLKDKVIGTGDTLFDSTVQELSFYREGLNNSGQVAFFASLANGTSGIFRADPIVVEPPKDVSEPASVLGLLAVGTFGATSVMKRKQKQ